MANVQLNFQGTQARLDRLFSAFARANGWSEQVLVDGVLTPNPVSFLAYGKDVIKSQIKEAAIRERANAAVVSAQTTAVAEITEDDANVAVTVT